MYYLGVTLAYSWMNRRRRLSQPLYVAIAMAAIDELMRSGFQHRMYLVVHAVAVRVDYSLCPVIGQAVWQFGSIELCRIGSSSHWSSDGVVQARCATSRLAEAAMGMH